MQDWFLLQFDKLIPVIDGIMFQDLTALHSAMASREKQGKNENTKIKIHQYKYLFGSEIMNCYFGKAQ